MNYVPVKVYSVLKKVSPYICVYPSPCISEFWQKGPQINAFPEFLELISKVDIVIIKWVKSLIL